jgi:hypothetical protein
MRSEMEKEVNTKLVDEYINSLSQKVNELQQENILLKAKASYNEKEYQERELQLKLELQQALDKIATPEVKKDEPVKKKPVPTFTSGTVKEVEEEQPEAKKKPKPMIKAPKPKGYNIEVDGPREVIPNPKFIEAEAKIN